MRDHDGPHMHGNPPTPHKCRETGAFIKGAFWGALAGAVLGILFAPDSGEKTRKKIKERSEEIAEKGKEVTDDLIDRVENIKDEVEPYIEPYKEKTEEFLKNAGEKVKEETENLKKRYFKGTK